MMQALYTFRGKVREGSKRGKPLGFPTANINLKKHIPEGIYTSQTKVDGKKYQSVVFIGSAKTFGETNYKAESYILDFNMDIYRKIITLKLYKKLRANKKFSSAQALVVQMKKDVLNTRQFFSRDF